MDLTSTILAVASPPGNSARGIVRISGDQTFDLLAKHLNTDIRSQRSAHPCRLRLRANDLPILILTFNAPHSYTGQDSAELQMPGNPILLQRVIDELLSTAQTHGIDARRAEAGQFTARAFMLAKLTLTQAEGVAAVIAAQSDAQLRAARLLATGKLSTFARSLADDLASALALVEAGLDFTDQEDVIPITPYALHDRLTALDEQMYNAPSGLTLYIFTSTLIGIIESRYVRKHIKEMDLTPKKKPDAKGKPKDAQGRAFSDAIARANGTMMRRARGFISTYKDRFFKKRRLQNPPRPSQDVGGCLSTFVEPFTEPVEQLWRGADLRGHRFDIVLQSEEPNAIVFNDDIASPWIQITRLPDGSGVDDRFFFAAEFVLAIQIIRWVEIRFVGEHAGYVRVSDQRVFVYKFKNLLHLHRGIERVLREEVFIDGPARRAVDTQEIVLKHSHAQLAEELPSLGGGAVARFQVELIATPVGGLFSCDVEIGRLVQDAEVVIPHQRPFTALGNQVHTFHRVWPVAEDIAEASS